MPCTWGYRPGAYVTRDLDGTAVKVAIRDKAHLVELLVDVFGQHRRSSPSLSTTQSMWRKFTFTFNPGTGYT